MKHRKFTLTVGGRLFCPKMACVICPPFAPSRITSRAVTAGPVSPILNEKDRS